VGSAQYYVDHPPRCLSAVRAEPVELDDIVFDGHSVESPNSVFRLVCKCGSPSHYFLGVLNSDPDPFGVPNAFGAFMENEFSLRCASCNRATELLDCRKHGYDGEMGNRHGEKTEGSRGELECPDCGGKHFQVFARFEYPKTLMEEVDEDWRGREQDLFSWFTFVVACRGCSLRGVVADEECA
jgi:hypothetical protein